MKFHTYIIYTYVVAKKKKKYTIKHDDVGDKIWMKRDILGML